MGCRCGGFTTRDISPWCEIHATIENLTEEERIDAIKRLHKSQAYTQKRIDALQTKTRKEVK